jgi:protein-S-isoprenylcysteine O-methyltransferase Ste14
VSLDLVETVLRAIGGAQAFLSLAVVLYGVWRGTRRPAGRASGRGAGWLRSAFFYLAATAAFLGASFAGWRDLPLDLTPAARWACLAVGGYLVFPGLALLLWARRALGRMYFVSTGFGAQLFAGHELVTSGPFAVVRHPMYLGLIAAALGSLCLYRTWTALVYAVCAPFLLLRARREERILAQEFGGAWRAYCRRVPAFLPRLRRRPRSRPAA